MLTDAAFEAPRRPLIRQTQRTSYTFKNGQIDDVFSIDASNPGGAVGAAIASATTCDKFTYVPAKRTLMFN